MSAPAYIVVRGQMDEVPPKLTTFAYFRDYFLNKMITEVGKIKTKKISPFTGGGMAGSVPSDSAPGSINRGVQ